MANIVKARLDATNKQIVLEVVDDTTGAVVTSWGAITLKLGQLSGTPTAPGHTCGQPLQVMETIGCDPTTGDPRYCFMVRSPWVSVPLTTDPET